MATNKSFEWAPIQLAVLNADCAQFQNLVQLGDDINIVSTGRLIPNHTLVHLAIRSSSSNTLQAVLSQPGLKRSVDMQDQFGFTPLHYAAAHGFKEGISILLQYGADINIKSANGCTAEDIAKRKNNLEILEMLHQHSVTTVVRDENESLFRNWLATLGAREYLQAFIFAGYDLPFIHKEGLGDADLDCVGIPMSKLGLRRKLKALYKLEEFYRPLSALEEENGEEEEEENEEEEEEENGEEEEETEDGSEECEDDDDDDEESEGDESDADVEED